MGLFNKVVKGIFQSKKEQEEKTRIALKNISNFDYFYGELLDRQHLFESKFVFISKRDWQVFEAKFKSYTYDDDGENFQARLSFFPHLVHAMTLPLTETVDTCFGDLSLKSILEHMMYLYTPSEIYQPTFVLEQRMRESKQLLEGILALLDSSKLTTVPKNDLSRLDYGSCTLYSYNEDNAFQKNCFLFSITGNFFLKHNTPCVDINYDELGWSYNQSALGIYTDKDKLEQWIKRKGGSEDI